MGRRAKNKQGPPEPFIPVKDATNKPVKQSSGLGAQTKLKSKDSVKRKVQDSEDAEIDSKRPIKKARQEDKTIMKTVISKGKEPSRPKVAPAKALPPEVDTDDDEESDGWEGIADGADLAASKK
jgi:hypothetical protein